MRKIIIAVCIMACVFSMLLLNEAGARQVRTTYDLFEQKDTVKVYVSGITNSSGVAGVDTLPPPLHRKMASRTEDPRVDVSSTIWAARCMATMPPRGEWDVDRKSQGSFHLVRFTAV